MTHIFSRFHHNNFRDTISWECVVKDDCIRSCLTELQSFPLSNFDPVHRVFVSSPLFSACTMQDKVLPSQLIFPDVFFVHRIHRREEYRLSVPARILSSVSILNCDGV